MKPEHWIAIGQGILTLVGMFIASKLAVRSSIKQFKEQKWWERLEQEYSRLSAALALNQYYLLETYGGFLGLPCRTLTDNDREDQRQLRHTLETIANGYVVSERTTKAIQDVLVALDTPSEGNDPFDGINLAIDAVRKCIVITNAEASLFIKHKSSGKTKT